MLEIGVYWLKAFALVIFSFIAPVHTLMICTGILIFADFVTGLMKAKKLKEKITSHKMKRTVIKSIVYQFGIMLALMLEVVFIPDIPVVKLVAATIAMVEATSLNENVKAIYGIDLFKAVIDKLQKRDVEEELTDDKQN